MPQRRREVKFIHPVPQPREQQQRLEAIPERGQQSVFFFSELNKIFFGYFDPENKNIFIVYENE